MQLLRCQQVLVQLPMPGLQTTPDTALHLMHPSHLQIWLVAEGAAESPSDLISLLDLDRDK